MHSLIDSSKVKKPTNLSISIDLLTEARALNINLSATLEQALIEKVRKEKRKQWLKDNSEAIQSCNQLVEKKGLFADKHGVF